MSLMGHPVECWAPEPCLPYLRSCCRPCQVLSCLMLCSIRVIFCVTLGKVQHVLPPTKLHRPGRCFAMMSGQPHQMPGSVPAAAACGLCRQRFHKACRVAAGCVEQLPRGKLQLLRPRGKNPRSPRTDVAQQLSGQLRPQLLIQEGDAFRRHFQAMSREAEDCIPDSGNPVSPGRHQAKAGVAQVSRRDRIP